MITRQFLQSHEEQDPFMFFDDLDFADQIDNEMYYDMDYKAVFDHQGLWNFEQRPSFDYEPPRFNL